MWLGSAPCTRVCAREAHAWRQRRGAAPATGPAVDAAGASGPAVGEKSAAATPAAVPPPTSSQAAPLAPAAPGASVVSKFAPWLEELRKELLALSHETVRLMDGEDVFADSSVDTDDDEAEARPPGRSAGEVVNNMQRLGAKLGGLQLLIRDELLPRLPADPDALFLAAAAHFISRDYDSALRRAREVCVYKQRCRSYAPGANGRLSPDPRLCRLSQGLMAAQRCSSVEAARRHYFLACCAIKILSGGSLSADAARRHAATGGNAATTPERRPVTGAKREELLAVAETNLATAVSIPRRFSFARLE